MPNETDAPDDRRPESADGDDREQRDGDRSEFERHAQVNDPDSPGATIDSDHPAEPNEPG